MKILITEDNLKAAKFLIEGLTKNFFTVEHASDGQEGLFLALEKNYDLIILDVL